VNTSTRPSVRPRTAAPKSNLAMFWKVLGQDISWGLRDLLVNAVGGNILVPRVLRYLIYRLAGLRIETPSIFPSCTFLGHGQVRIGPRTFVNRECYFEAVADISLGADSAVAMQVLFVTSAHTFDQDGRFASVATGLPIKVGDRCWIGARATVLPGVTIGDDVVVAAGSVVTRDCPSGGLYAGVPAVRIRELPRGPRPAADRTTEAGSA
jgi:maltose O-acetyltransferase